MCLARQLWVWSCQCFPQQLKYNPSVMWLDGSSLGTHGCSWATPVLSFLVRMGRGKGKSAKTAEKDCMGHFDPSCMRKPAPVYSGNIDSRSSPVCTSPAELLLTPWITESQQHEITLHSSLALEHRSDIWSSLGKPPVSKVFQSWPWQNYWKLQHVNIVTCKYSKRAMSDFQEAVNLWMRRARLHPWMCSTSLHCRNQINTMTP